MISTTFLHAYKEKKKRLIINVNFNLFNAQQDNYIKENK